jgi:hypothetical protein
MTFGSFERLLTSGDPMAAPRNVSNLMMNDGAVVSPAPAPKVSSLHLLSDDEREVRARQQFAEGRFMPDEELDAFLDSL